MYYTSYKRSLNGSDCSRQPDLFVAPSGTIKRSGRYNWMDVRVNGMTLALVASIDSSFFLHDHDIKMRICGRNWVENSKMVQDLVLSEQCL
jgi:hypothetical protein